MDEAFPFFRLLLYFHTSINSVFIGVGQHRDQIDVRYRQVSAVFHLHCHFYLFFFRPFRIGRKQIIDGGIGRHDLFYALVRLFIIFFQITQKLFLLPSAGILRDYRVMMPHIVPNPFSRFNGFFQQLHIPLKQSVIHLHQLVFFPVFVLFSDMKIEPEHQNLQGSGQEKVHQYLEKPVWRLFLCVGIQDEPDTEQNADNHNGNAESVQFILHIFAESPNGSFYFFINKNCHQQNQNNARHNIRPYISVKEQHGHFDSADKKYREQIKGERELIQRQRKRVAAHEDGKCGKAHIKHKRNHLRTAFPVNHIPDTCR